MNFYRSAKAALVLGTLACAASLASATGTEVNSNPASALAPAYSGGINEVVKLAKSGVDESVVLAYVKTSAGPFRPNANEIVKMRDEGVSSAVITAMLQRGSELRQSEQTQIAQAAQTAPAPTYTQPQVVAQPTYVEPVYTAPASTVVYIGGGYPRFSYPVYYHSYYPYYSYYPRYYSYRPGFHFYGGFNPRFSVSGRIGDVRFGGGFRGGFAGGHFSGSFGGGHFGGGFHHR